MPLRKPFKQMMKIWRVVRTNPKLRWAFARIFTSAENRKALQFYTAKLGVPPENVRELYIRMRNNLNRKHAVQKTIEVLQEIDELASTLNLHSTPWLKENLKHRGPEDVLLDLRQQAEQIRTVA